MYVSTFTKSNPVRLLLVLFSFLFIGVLSAQNSFVLSSVEGADSSQTFFEENAILYMHVTTTSLDVNQMMKMKWEITKEHKHGGMDQEYSGTFTNHYDSTFTASFNLSQLADSGKWKWKARLKDSNDQEVELESYFYYISTQDSGYYSFIKTEGFIQSIGGDSLTVNGYLFRVDSNTVFEYKDHQNIIFANLRVNDFVEIKASALDDGSYLAERIELKNNDEHHSELKTMGQIEALTDSSVQVNGMPFGVDGQTKIKGSDDQYLSLSDLSVGLLVKIEALQQADGSYLAVEIEVKQNDEHAMDMEIKGLVDSVGVDYIVVAWQKIFVDSLTKFEIKGNEQASFADLQTGMKVEVEAYRQNDGSLLAKKIEVEDGNAPYEKIEFTGAIDSVGVDFIIALGYTVFVDSGTVIMDSHFSPVTLSGLQKGQIVKVKGLLQNDGSILAYKIKVKDLWASFFEIEGAIENLGADWLTVYGITFMVDSNTVFYDVNKAVIAFTDLQAGQNVKVKARLNAQGEYQALMVKIKYDNVNRIEVTGAIEALTTDSIRVNGITFFTDSTTIVYDLQGANIAHGDLQLEQVVEVKGVLQADGAFKAVYIKVEDDPNLVDISSSLNGITNNSVIVSDKEFKLSASTVVLNSNFEAIDISSLTLGQPVTVWAVPAADGSMDALQLQETTLSAATAIDQRQASQVISSFKLNQNYPNPFNPSTTISFTLSGTFSTVKLEVFNLLGQKVKTIFNGVLNNGSYSFQWNGQNEAAQSVSSGIYFYRLQVDQKAQIRQMVLMK